MDSAAPAVDPRSSVSILREFWGVFRTLPFPIMSSTYQIRLPQFEGPFDLLLFFIERDELDIYNIPIHQITQEFLEYIHELEQLNIELASEFILFVSTLMRIKSRMLLPRREVDEQGNEVDPRQELVNKLLEYKRFKEVSEQMALLEADRLLQRKRGNIKAELEQISETYSEGTEIQTVTLYKLMQAFDRAMKKFRDRTEKPQHVVVKYHYTLDGQKARLIEQVRKHGRWNFENLFQQLENRIHAIFSFLAILELVQQQYILLLVGSGRNNFILEWNAERPADPADENPEETDPAKGQGPEEAGPSTDQQGGSNPDA